MSHAQQEAVIRYDSQSRSTDVCVGASLVVFGLFRLVGNLFNYREAKILQFFPFQCSNVGAEQVTTIVLHQCLLVNFFMYSMADGCIRE